MVELTRTIEWTGDRADREGIVKRQVPKREQLWEQMRSTGQGLWDTMESHRTSAYNLWLLGASDEAVAQARIASWYLRWWYRLRRLGDGESVELPVIGSPSGTVVLGRQERGAPAPNPTGLVRRQWTGDLVGPLLVADRRTIAVLADQREFDENRDPIDGPLQEHRAEIWRGLITQDLVRAGEHMVAYEALLAAESMQEPQLWKQQLISECSFFRAICQGSQADFSQAIIAAHHDHEELLKHSWGTHRIEVAIEPRTTALLRIGADSGLELEPQSPYFPDWTPWLIDQAPIAPEYEPI